MEEEDTGSSDMKAGMVSLTWIRTCLLVPSFLLFSFFSPSLSLFRSYSGGSCVSMVSLVYTFKKKKVHKRYVFCLNSEKNHN